MQTTNVTLENPLKASLSRGPIAAQGNSDSCEGKFRLSKQQGNRLARRMNDGRKCANLHLHGFRRIVKPLHLPAREIMLNRILDIRDIAGDPGHINPLHRMWILDRPWRHLPRKRIAGHDDRLENGFEFTRFYGVFFRPIKSSPRNAVNNNSPSTSSKVFSPGLSLPRNPFRSTI